MKASLQTALVLCAAVLVVGCPDATAPPPVSGRNAAPGQPPKPFRIHVRPDRVEPGHLLGLTTEDIEGPLLFVVGPMRMDGMLAKVKQSADGRLLMLLSARARLDGDRWSAEADLWCEVPVRFGVEGVTDPAVTCDGSPIENDSVLDPGTYALDVAGTIARQ